MKIFSKLKMKLKFLILLFSSVCFSQNKIVGFYRDYFGNKLELFENNKFKHTWHFDLASSWTIGNWKISKDTLKLEIVTVYDTLSVVDEKTNMTKDSLVIAGGEIPSRVTFNEYVGRMLSSGGQNRSLPNTLFLIKNQKLIIIKENGKLETEKFSNLSNPTKKYNSWYIKEEE